MCKYCTDEIIERILLGANRLQTYGIVEKPTVFMSRDIMAILEQHIECWRSTTLDCDITRVCGYDVKFTYGREELYVGFEA